MPTSSTSISYEWAIKDLTTFTDGIVGIMPMTKTDSNLYEYACHAGNYAIANILKGARAEELFKPSPGKRPSYSSLIILYR